MPKLSIPGAAALAAAVFAAAAAAPLAPDTPLVVKGPIAIVAADFEGNMLRIPEEKRPEVRMSYDRVASIVDSMFVARSLAARAREAGLDKDPAVQRRLQQAQDGVLADLYMQKLEKEAVVGSLEQRARELHKAEPARYMTPEEVNVQHILVNLVGRTREAAMERAKNVAEEARAGEDFLSLAARYSDDPDKRRNGGNLGWNSPSSFNESVRKAIAAAKAQGEIVGPVESESGFHVVKLVERRAPQPIPFEAVRKKLIAAETDRLRKERVENLIREVRSAPDVVIHRRNVEALVTPVDPAALKRAQEDASGAASVK